MKPAIAAIKEILLDYLAGLTDEERESWVCLFSYMDLILHYAYQPYRTLADDDLDKASKAIQMTNKLLKALMPTITMKVHVWKHLDEDL